MEKFRLFENQTEDQMKEWFDFFGDFKIQVFSNGHEILHYILNLDPQAGVLLMHKFNIPQSTGPNLENHFWIKDDKVKFNLNMMDATFIYGFNLSQCEWEFNLIVT